MKQCVGMQWREREGDQGDATRCTVFQTKARPQCDALRPTPCSPLPPFSRPPALQGKRTVPQIFINGAFIGGAEELDQLASSGQLAQRLG